MTEALMSTYSRLPVSFERGEGAWLWDSAGKKYLDAISGVAVCGLGHAHPAVAEAVQCEGGVYGPDDNYLAGVRALCDQHGWLMMLDEVQTGMGRTGRWFGYQHSAVVPDVITLAKGLANGVPIGACLARGEAADTFKPGNHASTFGGNPLACSAALAVIDTLEADHLTGRAARLGERISGQLRERLDGNKAVHAIRTRGLMIGIELDRPCTELVGMALQRGLLINVTAERVIRLLPPLILSDAEADQIANGVAELIIAHTGERA